MKTHTQHEYVLWRLNTQLEDPDLRSATWMCSYQNNPKSREISFVHNIRFNSSIILKLFINPSRFTDVLCAKFPNDLGKWEIGYEQTKFHEILV